MTRQLAKKFARLQTVLSQILNIKILIYLFSPIDILPEAVLGPLGLVDDAAAIALLIRILLKK